MSKMILPDDVLGVIRALAKPRLQFAKQFNDTAERFKKLATVPRLVDSIKAKLMTEDAAKVIELFVAFVDSYEATRDAQQKLTGLVFRTNPEEWLGYVTLIMVNMEKREAATKNLFMAVYGKYEIESDTESEVELDP